MIKTVHSLKRAGGLRGRGSPPPMCTQLILGDVTTEVHQIRHDTGS